MSIAHPSESIWLPGAGELRFDELQAARAVEEYDPNLTLGQDKRSGQWAVFLPDREGNPFPVLGLGHDLPAPERIKERLYKQDIRRNGRVLLAEMDAHAAKADKDFQDKVDEATTEVAEAIASNMMEHGTHPYPTIHMGGRNKGKVRSA